MTERAAGDEADGWVKYAGNPVLGGSLGTCFDMSVDVSDGRAPDVVLVAAKAGASAMPRAPTA